MPHDPWRSRSRNDWTVLDGSTVAVMVIIAALCLVCLLSVVVEAATT